jgi:hypothetical protein
MSSWSGRWFVAKKTPESVKLHAVYDAAGALIYSREVLGPLETWWIFQELPSGAEKPAGPLKTGLTCCTIYPDADQHVLACVYSHKPLAGYPRYYQVPPDDLPSEVREGCFEDKQKRLYFPARERLPSHLQPIYGVLAAAVGPNRNFEDIIREDLVPNVLQHRGPDEPLPGN